MTDFASVYPQLISPLNSRFIVAAQGTAWFSPVKFPEEGSLTRCEPQPQTPPGLTPTPRASLLGLPPIGQMAKAAYREFYGETTLDSPRALCSARYAPGLGGRRSSMNSFDASAKLWIPLTCPRPPPCQRLPTRMTAERRASLLVAPP